MRECYRKSFWLVCACLMAGVPVTARAQTVLNYPPVVTTSSFGGLGEGPGEVNYFGQTFIAPTSAPLESFQFYLFPPSNAPGYSDAHLTFHIAAWNGAAPVGASLYTSPTLTIPTGAANGYAAYAFSPDISLAAGQQYVAYLQQTLDGATVDLNTALSFDGLLPPGESGIDYTGGTMVVQPFVGFGWIVNPNFDLGFQAVFAGRAAAPEPTTVSLLAAGVFALSLPGWRTRFKKGRLRRTAG